MPGDWGNVYSGASLETTITNLEPQNVYRFRMRAMHDDDVTAWSPIVTVTTTSTSALSIPFSDGNGRKTNIR